MSNIKTIPNGPDSWVAQTIQFCGYDASFIGDIYVTPFAITVVSKKAPISLKYGDSVKDSKWHITDENGGYWNTQKGVFVLSRESVTRFA